MSDIKFSLYEYDLPLVRPFRLKNSELRSRVGLIIVGERIKGGSASGEIAPLPFFSSETFPIAKEEAITITRSINEGKSHVIESLKRAARSVAFGFESVLQRLNKSRLGASRSSVAINALLSGDPSNILSQALEKKEAGFKSFKIKIGTLPTDETIALIKELSHTLGDDCDLRLDANRSLSVEQTMQLADQLADIGIEYFEEPVSAVDELKTLLGKSAAIQLALDESLADAANDFLLECPQVTTLVIKPTILGPFRTKNLVEKTRKSKKKIVISSSFESPIGIAVLARMAASIAGDTPCGLDTLSIFADNPFGCHDWIKKGRITIDDLPETFGLSSGSFTRLV